MTVKCGGIRDESDITKVRKSNVKESIKMIITFLREKSVPSSDILSYQADVRPHGRTYGRTYQVSVEVIFA